MRSGDRRIVDADGRETGGDLFRDGRERLRVGWRLVAFGALLAVLVVVGVALLPAPGIVAQSAVILGAALVAGWILLAWTEDRPPAALGFYLHRDAVGETIRGLALGAGVALAAVAAMALTGAVSWVPDEGTVVELLAEGGAALAFLALPAAAEEALFRGYPLQALAKAWGRGPALVVTSLGFGLLHLANPGLTAVALANLVVAGAFLGVVYLRTGSLWAASAAHLGWNWAHAFVVDLPVSGLELVDTPLWDGVVHGAEWHGGGAFGPEGSVLTTVVAAGATALLWWGPSPSPGEAARAARPLTPLPGGEDPDPERQPVRGAGAGSPTDGPETEGE